MTVTELRNLLIDADGDAKIAVFNSDTKHLCLLQFEQLAVLSIPEGEYVVIETIDTESINQELAKGVLH